MKEFRFVQKVLIMSTAEQISEKIRPEVQEAVGQRAHLVQAVPNMLEVLPVGASKV